MFSLRISWCSRRVRGDPTDARSDKVPDDIIDIVLYIDYH